MPCPHVIHFAFPGLLEHMSCGSLFTSTLSRNLPARHVYRLYSQTPDVRRSFVNVTWATQIIPKSYVRLTYEQHRVDAHTSGRRSDTSSTLHLAVNVSFRPVHRCETPLCVTCSSRPAPSPTDTCNGRAPSPAKLKVSLWTSPAHRAPGAPHARAAAPRPRTASRPRSNSARC